MKIGPREQVILVIVGLLVVLVAVAALLVWPQYQKQKALDVQIATAEQQLKTAQTLLAQRQEIKNRTAVTDAQWLKLAALVPQNPDLPSLIIELQDAAFASGVQIVSIAPSDPTNTGGHWTIPLEIRFVGTWADTVDYMKSINKLNRGLREVSFVTATAPEKTGDPLLPYYSVSTTVKLSAYMIKAAESSATPTPAAP
ncbi:MAG: type 4a pilus biogenesis protein PilO [Actinomycetes bacterium]